MWIATRQVNGQAETPLSCPSRHAANGQPGPSCLVHLQPMGIDMTEQVTIQAPTAPATGKQWGLIRFLAKEAGYEKATDAIKAVFGFYEPKMLNRARASTVIEALKTRNEQPAEDPPLAIAAPAPQPATPQVDALPGMAPLGMAEPTSDTTEPELDLGNVDQKPVAVECKHWGTLEVAEVAVDPDDPDEEVEYEINCRACGAVWAQVETGNPHTIQ